MNFVNTIYLLDQIFVRVGDLIYEIQTYYNYVDCQIDPIRFMYSFYIIISDVIGRCSG